MPTTTIPMEQHSTSYREALAWACLGTLLVTYAPYFTYIYRLFRAANVPGTAFPYGSYPALGATILAQIILGGVAVGLITWWRKPENRDERDAAIEARAYRYAYLVFTGLIFFLFFAAQSMLATSQVRPSHPGEVPCLVQLLLLDFTVAEIVRYAVQVIGYRRGY